MADVLVRLDVQSEAYESKLKNATANLQHMEKEVRRVGATFEVADKEDLEFIKSLGSMETHATNASGKIKEMTQSIAEMTMVYNKMSDAEKNAATGQALAASIAQQKGNLAEFKNALADASGEAQKTGGFIDTLADGLGQLGPVGQMAGKLLKGAFGPVGIAIAAVVGIIQQLVSAFKRNEDAMAGAARAAAPFKAIWQQIQRLFDKLVPYIAEGMEKIANVMSGVFNKFTGWIEKLGNTALGKKLGLDKVAEQMKNVTVAQNELTTSNKRIADSENALNKLRRSATVNNARDEKEIAKLREQASERDKYTATDRVAMLEEAAQLEEQIMQRNLNIKRKELEVIKLKNSLTQSGTEDLQAQADAEAAVLQEETNFYNKKRALQRQLQAARNEDAKDQAGGGDAGASNVKDAATMWGEYTKKLEETKARLAEFKAMIEDMSLSQEQRDWAAGMADAYQEQLDKMKGVTEETVDDIKSKMEELPSIFDQNREALDRMSAGVGAISTLGNAFNDLKGIGEDLASAFSGEMDAWESLMTVFNSGIGIMQTVIGVMEAINTLTELSNTLSDIKVAKQGAEATAVVTGKGSEMAATAAEASVSAAELGVDTADAAAKAGKAVAWIPIVGPALAAAAIAAIVGAIMAAQSKAKSAGNFATGGLIPGSSFSGDNLTANVNSGELILNRAQQGAIAGQLSGGATQTVVVEGRISGKDILLSANNTNRAAGGTRGYYTKVK